MKRESNNDINKKNWEKSKEMELKNGKSKVQCLNRLNRVKRAHFVLPEQHQQPCQRYVKQLINGIKRWHTNILYLIKYLHNKQRKQIHSGSRISKPCETEIDLYLPEIQMVQMRQTKMFTAKIDCTMFCWISLTGVQMISLCCCCWRWNHLAEFRRNK